MIELISHLKDDDEIVLEVFNNILDVKDMIQVEVSKPTFEALNDLIVSQGNIPLTLSEYDKHKYERNLYISENMRSQYTFKIFHILRLDLTGFKDWSIR